MVGGFAIVLAVIAALGIAGELPLWMLAGTLALLAVGIVDDLMELTPLRKLLAQLAEHMARDRAATSTGS